MRAHRSDRGASIIEYVGLIVLSVLILGSLSMIGIPGTIRDGLTPVLCKIVGGASCGNNAAARANTDSERPSDGTPPLKPHQPPHPSRPPVTAGKDPGLLPSLGRTLGYHFQGLANFTGFGLVKWAPHQPVTPFNDGAGIARELWEQAKGVGSFAKMTWCSTGWCTDGAVKEARDGWSYIFHHPGEAAKQAGYSIVEPCVKAYRAPNQNETGYWSGRCFTSLVTTVVGAKGLGKLGKLANLGKAAKLADVARIVKDTDRAANDAERAAKAGDLPGARKAATSARSKANDAARAARKRGDRSGHARQAARNAGRAERAANTARFQMSPDKWRYIFGKAARSDKHNYDRSIGNLTQMRKVGVYDNFSGRRLIGNHLRDTLQNDGNIRTAFARHGSRFQIRDSLFKAPGGFLHLETTWEKMPDGHLRFVTIIAKGK